MQKGSLLLVVGALLSVLCLLCGTAWAQFSSSASPRILENFRRLHERTNGAAKISHSPNGAVFLSFPVNEAVPIERLVSNAPDLRDSSNALQSMSLAFVQEYHALWGFHSAGQVREQLFVKGTTSDSQISGLSHVHMEQRFGGVRVFGGDLRAHFTGDGKLSAINGLMVNNINLDTIPSTEPDITAEEASLIAINHVAQALLTKQARSGPKAAQYPEDLKGRLVVKPVSSKNLLIFRKDVISLNPKDAATTRLVWEIEVFSSSVVVRDQVMVDAHSGQIVNHISLVQHSLNRHVFEAAFLPQKLIWEEGDEMPTNDTDLMHVLTGSQAFYDFFSRNFDWLSFDGNDSLINSIYRVTGSKCPNAWWDGEKISYCTGIVALDVAVHELTHGVTSYTDDLYYQFQSGALNEAYSDIFGETVNILSGDSLHQVLRTTGNCSTYGQGSPAGDVSTRWLIGEDIAYEYMNKHGLRDMWRPECYGYPDSVKRNSYFCLDYDNGGVHINSGVINHAYALAVDGGEFGGQSITGIGFNKAVAVWWRAKRHYHSVTTNFVDHANALLQSCTDLTGQVVRNVTTGTPQDTISASDCEQISNAIKAVNMTVTPMSVCDFANFSKVRTSPEICPSGEAGNLFFSNDFASVPNDWTQESIDPSHTTAGYPWQYVCNLNYSVCGLWSISYSNLYCPNPMPLNVLHSPPITIPSDGTAVLSFMFSIETFPSENGGSVVALVNDVERSFSDSDFLINPYNGVINNQKHQLNTEKMWTGYTGASIADFNYNTENQLFQTRIKVNNLKEGDKLEFKFLTAEDLCRGSFGFFITDVSVTMCAGGNDGSSQNASAASELVSSMSGMLTAILAVIALMALFMA